MKKTTYDDLNYIADGEFEEFTNFEDSLDQADADLLQNLTDEDFLRDLRKGR